MFLIVSFWLVYENVLERSRQCRETEEEHTAVVQAKEDGGSGQKGQWK